MAASTGAAQGPVHGGCKAPDLPSALDPESIGRVPMPTSFSLADLFSLTAWEATVLPHVAAATAPATAASVDALVRAAVTAAELDKHFEAERLFGDALGLLHTEEAKRAASSSAASKARVSAAGALPVAQGAPVRAFVGSSMGLRMARDFVVSSKAMQIVVAKCRDARSIMIEASIANATWRPVSVDSVTGYGTYYRGEPGLSTQSFKVVGLVHAEVVSLACVLLELDLYKEWFPFCYFSEVTAEDGRFHKSSRFAIRLPWPLANREVAITGFGMDDLDLLRVVVKASSMLGEEPQKGNVMAELKLGGFFIEPVAKMDTRITFFMNIDPHIPHLPVALLNWVSGNLMWVVLRQISKAAEKAMDPKSVYAKRRKARPDVYDYFTRRGSEVLAHLPDRAPNA